MVASWLATFIEAYRISDQPCSVMTWKMLSDERKTLSKDVNPELGLTPVSRQTSPTGHVLHGTFRVARTISRVMSKWQRLLKVPLHSCVPRIPKMQNSQTRRIRMSMSSGIESSSVETSIRIPGTPWMVFSGLRARAVRSPLRFPVPGARAMNPTTTTTKSSTRQGSPRYVLGPIMKHRATIWIRHSMPKRIVKTSSDASSMLFQDDPSGERGSNMARKMQLATMRAIMIRSNCFQFRTFHAYSRTGLYGLKMYSESLFRLATAHLCAAHLVRCCQRDRSAAAASCGRL